MVILSFLLLSVNLMAQNDLTLMNCKSCSTPLSDANVVQLESLAQCSPERQYMQGDLMMIEPEFRNKRQSEEGSQFPLACIVHAQRTFTWKIKANPENPDDTTRVWGGLEAPTSTIARCSSTEGAPVRGGYLPCVTSEYAYSVYNAFQDMADCFDIKSRKLLPKLWNESGFHINTLGGGMDAGVGQLTRSAIEEVLAKPYASDDRTALQIFHAQAKRSSKPSCQRLARQEKAFEAVNPDVSQRCSIMATPENPIRNIVYLGVFYKLNERATAARMSSTKMKEKIEQLGFSNPNMEYFKDAIVTLSFNAGRGSAFSLVETYLKSKIINNKKLTAKDLDFLSQSIDDIRTLRREPKDETEEQRSVRHAKLNAAKEKAHTMSLPAFLRLMHGLQSDFEIDPAKKQINGAPGYLTFVGERQKKYDKELGEGVCTQSSFLQYQ